jgi:hypothetical protein
MTWEEVKQQYDIRQRLETNVLIAAIDFLVALGLLRIYRDQVGSTSMRLVDWWIDRNPPKRYR